MSDVCIFGLNVVEALENRVIGGAELQMSVLAKTLARSGISVTIVDPVSAGSRQYAQNLSLADVPGWKRGVRGLRFFTHRLSSMVRTLRKTGAGVFYCRGFTFLYVVPLVVSKFTLATFVLATAHDADLMTFRERYRIFYRNDKNIWSWITTVIPDELVYSMLIRYSDILVVQHQSQAALARSRGKEVVELNNIVDGDVFTTRPDGDRMNVVVVGALSIRKGLPVLIPVVRKLKSVTFEFIGGEQDIEGAEVKKELQQLPNVVLHGWLERSATLGKIAGAKVLLNTSKMEGFPNTFLEAWALETPVISLYVDPGDVISTHKLGYFCDGNIEMMEKLLGLDSYDLDTRRVRQYVVDNHSMGYAARIFGDILRGASRA
jgi:glycosyltransferase involved in cell wall biosynthesis